MAEIAPPSTLRERRRQETRNEIRRIALALVEGRGYDAVTVELVSQRAGVSVRTFFTHFTNKDSVLIATPPVLPQSAVDTFLSRQGPRDLFTDLAELAVSMFSEGASVPSDFEASIRIVMGVPTLAALQHGALAERENQFVELIAARLALGPDDVQPAVIAAAFTGAIRVACQRWSRNDARRSFAQDVRGCTRLLSAASLDTTAGNRPRVHETIDHD